MALKDTWETGDAFTAADANAVADAVNTYMAAIAQSAGQVITHGSNSDQLRPSQTGAVIWVGSVLPNNALDGDIWIDTSGTAPTIATTVLNGFNVSSPFSQYLVASGTTPLRWSLSLGALPHGIIFSDDGNLYGMPTVEDDFDFTVQALNGFGVDAQRFTGTVGSPIHPTILTTTLGPVTTGIAFSSTVSCAGSIPITFSVQSGALPTDLTLDSSTGIISGTPSVLEDYTVIIRATNAVGYDEQTFSGSVTGVGPTITASNLSSIWRGAAVNQTPLTVSGSPTLRYEVHTGSLPPELILNTSTGAISGTPTTVGTYSFTIRVTNSYGAVDQPFANVQVLESTPVITETSLNILSVGVPFSQTLHCTPPVLTPITWSVTGGTIPPGLSIDSSTGVISGNPTTVNPSYDFTVGATNSVTTGYQEFTGAVTDYVVALSGATGAGTVAGSTYGTLGGSTGTSWTQPANAGDTVLFFLSKATAGGVTSVTFGGTPMTQLAISQDQRFRIYRADVSGSGTVAFTCTADYYSAWSVAYSSVGSIVVAANTTAGSAVTTASQSGTNVAKGMLVSAWGTYTNPFSGTQTPTPRKTLSSFTAPALMVQDTAASGLTTFTENTTFGVAISGIVLVLHPTGS